MNEAPALRHPELCDELTRTIKIKGVFLTSIASTQPKSILIGITVT